MLRDEAYHILSDMIYKGFLSLTMELNGKLLIFKTVSDKELSLIKLRSGFGLLANNRSNLNFMAYSLLMVDDESFLDKREDNYEVILKFLREMPGALYKNILSELLSFRDKVFDSFKFLEGFCYTDQSRRMWEILGNNLPNSELFTGIKGTEKLGLNYCQSYWVDINRSMDSEERSNQEFSLALFQVSSANPKGAKKNKAQHDAHIVSTNEKRKKIASLGYMVQDNWSQNGWAVKADTAEALVAELNRQMQGVKDKHDHFVDKYLEDL